MSAPISIGGRDDLRRSISIGVARHTPGSDGDDLLSNADAAMYEAKSLGGGRMCQFDAALRADVLDRLTVACDFRVAVANHERTSAEGVETVEQLDRLRDLGWNARVIAG